MQIYLIVTIININFTVISVEHLKKQPNCYRAGALPFHDPDSSLSGVANITDDPSNPNSKSNATFFEPRPHRDTTYYVIVVSHGEVEFKVRHRLRELVPHMLRQNVIIFEEHFLIYLM